MELTVGMEPYLGAAILMGLEVRYDIVNDRSELVLQGRVKADPFCPNSKTRAPFGGVGTADGDINRPCRVEGREVLEGGLQLRLGLNDVGFPARQGIHHAVNGLSDVPVPEVLVAMELGKVVDVEFPIGNAFH
jgi:hypothetical protein